VLAYDHLSLPFRIEKAGGRSVDAEAAKSQQCQPMTDEGTYGPALSELTEKQRTFVWAMATVRAPDGKRIKRSHAAGSLGI
jgi:hypothetical protein